MKRIIKIDGSYGQEKYQMVEEYRCFGIYQRICGGTFVCQEWMIQDGADSGAIPIQIESYNDIEKAEILDAIDSYLEDGWYGFKVFSKDDRFVVHPNGKHKI